MRPTNPRLFIETAIPNNTATAGRISRAFSLPGPLSQKYNAARGSLTRIHGKDLSISYRLPGRISLQARRSGWGIRVYSIPGRSMIWVIEKNRSSERSTQFSENPQLSCPMLHRWTPLDATPEFPDFGSQSCTIDPGFRTLRAAE